MAIQKIISGSNILQGSAVILSGQIGGTGHNINRARVNDIDVTASNARYQDRLCFYNALTNESGAHKSFLGST